MCAMAAGDRSYESKQVKRYYLNEAKTLNPRDRKRVFTCMHVGEGGMPVFRFGHNKKTSETFIFFRKQNSQGWIKTTRVAVFRD